MALGVLPPLIEGVTGVGTQRPPQGPPQQPPAAPLPSGAATARPHSPIFDIRQWVQSLAGGKLMQYSEQLFATFDDLRQIRDLYPRTSIEDFFEDVGIESEEHRQLFRKALEDLRHTDL